MEFIRSQSVGEASPGVSFHQLSAMMIPSVCSSIRWMITYGIHMPCNTRVKFHRGRGFVDLLSDKMFSFSLFVCWMNADGTSILINRG